MSVTRQPTEDSKNTFKEKSAAESIVEETLF